MESSCLANISKGEGSVESLIIPKITSERKRRVLTDAIHYCFKQMLEKNLVMSTISPNTSTLAKLIGQEMFFRIVKMIYDIQFNVNKEVVKSHRKKKKGDSYNQSSTKDVLEEVIVKRAAPSLIAEESNNSFKNGNGAYSPSQDERLFLSSVQEKTARELKPRQAIRTQGKDREKTTSTATEEIRVKREPQSPPSFMEEELHISSKDGDSTYLTSQEKTKKVAKLKPHQAVEIKRKNREKTSSVSRKEFLEDVRIRSSSSPSSKEKESDTSSEYQGTGSPTMNVINRRFVPCLIKVRRRKREQQNQTLTGQ